MRLKTTSFLLLLATAWPGAMASDNADILLILGQSNADGSAFVEPDADAPLRDWYYNSPEAKDLHIWYAPTQVVNTINSLGNRARHVTGGRYRDAEPGWMRLWFCNDNAIGRTAMNMIHDAGTYSISARGRRGIEGELGRRWTEEFPGQQLYVIKLGVSGSGIDSWANEADDHNWHYFIDSVYTPAMNQLLAEGKRPRLAGIWWMQGCADQHSSEQDYRDKLQYLITRLREATGFADAPFYIGLIPAQGEGDTTPEGSVGYGEGVRRAQEATASSIKNVFLIPTADCPMQYEETFRGCIHFSQKGMNCIADHLVDAIKARGTGAWPYLKR